MLFKNFLAKEFLKTLCKNLTAHLRLWLNSTNRGDGLKKLNFRLPEDACTYFRTLFLIILYMYFISLKKGVAIHCNKFKSPSPNDTSSKVLLSLSE